MSLQREQMNRMGVMPQACTPEFSVNDRRKASERRVVASTLLPQAARDLLMRAARSGSDRRDKDFQIDDAIDVVKKMYPAFFQQ